VSRYPANIALERALGHTFSDSSLLRSALSHPIVSLDKEARQAFQRLEFLGDRVLALAVASMLFNSRPGDAEGEMTVKLISLVRKEYIAGVARRLDVPSFLGYSAANDSVLADTMEAIIGAIHLDAGVTAALNFVKDHWRERPDDGTKDSKTQLQELAQQRFKALPRYEVLSVTGPAHNPVFLIEVAVGDAYRARAEGSSKREAQTKAAAICMVEINKVS
jgi:ribonuclease-3